MRRLHAEGCQHIITRLHAELDLRNQSAVEAFFPNRNIPNMSSSPLQEWAGFW